MIKKLILICLFVFLTSPSQAAITFDGSGAWETSFDCDEWEGPQTTGEIGCGITRWGNVGIVGNTLWDQITTDANHSAGGAGIRGMRQWIYGDGVTNPAPSTQGKLVDWGTEAQYNVWVRFYVRFESGMYLFPDDVGTKLLFFKRSNLSNAHYLIVGENLLFTTGSYGISPVNDIWANYFGDGSENDVSDGSWHCIEAQIKSETVTSAPFDGEMRVWVDDTLVAEEENINTGLFSIGETLRGVALQQNWHTLPNYGSVYVDFDDIAIYNTTPPNADADGNPYIGPLTASDTTAPTISSFSINGDTATATADEALTIGAGGSGGWVATMSGQGTVTYTYTSTNGLVVTFTGDKTVAAGETGTVNYTQPTNGFEDSSGNDLASISAMAVTVTTPVEPTQNFSTSNPVPAMISDIPTDNSELANGAGYAYGTDPRFTDARTPTAHASTHTNGTDDIQSATNTQKGLATADHISAIESNTANSHASGSDAETAGTIEDIITGSGAETTPADAWVFPVIVSEVLKKVTWANIVNALDSLYQPLYSGIITDNATSLTGSGSITVTETQCYRGKLKDDGLTGAADIELDDLEDDVSVLILINYGTYDISACPPSGEKLRVDISGTMTWLDANDEADLTSVEGELFVAHRRYSNTETAWYWEIRAIEGSITDGGEAD